MLATELPQGILVRHLDADNAPTLLSIGDTLHLSTLKAAATGVIVHDFDKVSAHKQSLRHGAVEGQRNMRVLLVRPCAHTGERGARVYSAAQGDTR